MSFFTRLRAYWLPTASPEDADAVANTLWSQPVGPVSYNDVCQLATLARRFVDGGGTAALDDLTLAIDARPASAAPKVAMAIVAALKVEP